MAKMTPSQVMLAAFGAVGVALVLFARKHGEAIVVPDNGGPDDLPLPSVAAQALRELQFWNGQLETDSAVEDRLARYWIDVLGKHPAAEFGSNWKTEVPWSAAFISSVVNKAAPGSLLPSRGHWQYARDAVDKVGVVGKYAAFAPGTQPYEVGDILVRSRNGEKDPPSFSDLKKFGFKESHGDIVTAVEPGGRIQAVGGNLSNSVRQALYTEDDPRLIAHLKLQKDLGTV